MNQVRTKNELLNLGILLEKFCKDFERKKFRVILNSGEVFNSKYLFFYYYLLNKSLNKNKYNVLIKDFLRNSEEIFPGSSYFLAKNIYEMILYNKVVKKENNLSYAEINRKNIIKYFKHKSHNSNFENILNIIDFIGPDGSIICNSSKNNHIVCERKDKTFFDFKIEKELEYSLFKSDASKINSCYIVICDVFFERETDIFPLIEKASKERKNIVIICRGSTKRFIDQIKKEMLRNNILIYVYTDKFSNEDPFKMKDFSDSICADILSKEKGNIIARDILEYSLLAEVVLNKRSIEFYLSKKSLLKDKINKSIKNCKDKNLLEYLKFRKQRILTKIAHVYIPETNKVLLQDFKDIINCYNKVLKYGLYKDNNNILHSKLSYDNTIEMSNKLYNILSKTKLVLKES